jgi:hypothetical protein
MGTPEADRQVQEWRKGRSEVKQRNELQIDSVPFILKVTGSRATCLHPT